MEKAQGGGRRSLKLESSFHFLRAASLPPRTFAAPFFISFPAMDASTIHTIAVALGSLALAAFLAWFVK